MIPVRLLGLFRELELEDRAVVEEDDEVEVAVERLEVEVEDGVR